MFNCFFPDEYLDSTYVINFDDLYAQGYRGLLFDIDNTLVPHGAPADERACALFAHLKELGFKCCFLQDFQICTFLYMIGKFLGIACHNSSGSTERHDLDPTVFFFEGHHDLVWCRERQIFQNGFAVF